MVYIISFYKPFIAKWALTMSPRSACIVHLSEYWVKIIISVFSESDVYSVQYKGLSNPSIPERSVSLHAPPL